MPFHSGVNTPIRQPNCQSPDTCIITFDGSCTTLVGWSPIFDGNGNLLNVNPNTVERLFECATCNKKWIRKTCGDEETFVMLN